MLALDSQLITRGSGWKRPFDDPILPSCRRQLRHLQDAGTCITKLPKAEHDTPPNGKPQWKAYCSLLSSVARRCSRESTWALNRYVERVFGPMRKDPRWGKRKPARTLTFECPNGPSLGKLGPHGRVPDGG